jgi:hypothetical protein
VKLPILQDRYHISILDGGADSCVLGKGWKLLTSQDSRRANVFGFDHEDSVKRNLPIVSAITAVDLPDGLSILLPVLEAIYNDTGNRILLSEFQLRELGVQIDSTCHRHGGTQQMVIRDNSESLVVPLELSSCMVNFKHRLLNDEEVMSLKQYCLTRGEYPWNPLAFSDQVEDKNLREALDEKKKEDKANLKSKNEIDYLFQVHELDMAEKRKDVSLKCYKILESCEDRGDDYNTCHDCYMVYT